jgi:probable HAF family extracellular repeat protein
MRILAAITLAASFGLTTPTTALAQASYTVKDLGALPGDASSVAWGINANGDVVGWSIGSNGTRGFVFRDFGGLFALPGLPNRPRTVARDINDIGDIVGSANAGGTDLGHAVAWSGGDVTDLGTLGDGPYGEALAINNFGQIVGTSYIDGSTQHGWLFTPGAGIRDLTPNSDRGAATDINDAGQVTGYKTAIGGYHAFRWDAGQFLDLGVLAGFADSFGYAINRLGQVAGHSGTASGNSERFVRFTDGKGLEDLGGTGEHNALWGINASGDVAGCRGESLRRAVRFTDAGRLQELNDLIDPSSGWVLLCATDINDAGQIAGYAFNNYTGVTHAVRLDPTNEPPAECTFNCLRSTDIAFSIRAKDLFGDVTVRAETGTLIVQAGVVARWTYPDGSTADSFAWTTSKGKARFVTPRTQKGTYTLTVMNIVKSLYTFNPSDSVLSKSVVITK